MYGRLILDISTLKEKQIDDWLPITCLKESEKGNRSLHIKSFLQVDSALSEFEEGNEDHGGCTRSCLASLDVAEDSILNIAYNIVNGECSPLKNISAPLMTEPQPKYSTYREANFGKRDTRDQELEHTLTIVGTSIQMDMRLEPTLMFTNRHRHPMNDST
ncbi:hypothetical protein Tco_1237753 [Tanacetum coccineum]